MEIITLQFGTTANTVGSHFWNHELFGSPAPKGELKSLFSTHVEGKVNAPRFIAFDHGEPTGAVAKDQKQAPAAPMAGADLGSLGSLGSLGIRAGVEVIRSSLELPSASSPLKWIETLKVPLPRKAFGKISGDADSFNRYWQGQEYFASKSEDLIDRFRVMIEDCDSPQGIHCLVEVDSGFGGLASSYLSSLRDDDPKIPIFTLAIEPHHIKTPKQIANYKRRAINKALATRDLMGISNLVLPMSASGWGEDRFPGLHVVSEYGAMDTTAMMLAAAIHTISLPYRVAKRSTSLHNYCQDLSPFARLNLLSLSSAAATVDLFDIPVLKAPVIVDDRVGRPPAKPIHRSSYMTPFSPTVSIPKEYKEVMISEWCVLRGFPSPPLPDDGHFRVIPKSPWEEFDDYCSLLDRTLPCRYRQRSDASTISLLLPAPPPPSIPTPSPPSSLPPALLAPPPPPPELKAMIAASMLCDIHSCRSTELYINYLLEESVGAVSKGGIRGQSQVHHAFDQDALPADALADLRHSLIELRTQYRELSS